MAQKSGRCDLRVNEYTASGDLRVNEDTAYSRRQLLANAAIAASRVGS
jgi:hypothetical protein